MTTGPNWRLLKTFFMIKNILGITWNARSFSTQLTSVCNAVAIVLTILRWLSVDHYDNDYVLTAMMSDAVCLTGGQEIDQSSSFAFILHWYDDHLPSPSAPLSSFSCRGLSHALSSCMQRACAKIVRFPVVLCATDIRFLRASTTCIVARRAVRAGKMEGGRRRF